MDWWEAGLRLFLAAAVGCVIGVERERKNRPAGMRTHVLVCVGAALIAIMERYLSVDALNLNLQYEASGVTVTLGRLSAQVISGIGFLGAGTIFIAQKKIAGLTTAASLWNAACLGLVAGMGFYALAVAGCAVVMVTLTFLQKVVKVQAIKNVEVKFSHRLETIAFINEYFERMGIQVLDIDFHVENKGEYNLYTNLYTLDMKGKASYKDIVNYLSENANVQVVRTRNT